MFVHVVKTKGTNFKNAAKHLIIPEIIVIIKIKKKNRCVEN